MNVNTNDAHFGADGLYPMTIEQDHSFRYLGGPFDNLDDVLDACFDDMLHRDRTQESYFYIECRHGQCTYLAFPFGAFPIDPEDPSRITVYL